MTAPAALATRAIASGPIAGTLPDAPNAHDFRETVYVAELVAYDPALPGTRTLRYATHGFATRGTDSPADTAIDGRLLVPGDVARALGSGLIPGPRAQVTFGEVILLNPDGALDALADYGWGGRAVTVRRGPIGGRYPYDFPIDFVAEAEAITVTRTDVRLRLRDGRRDLETPLQTTRYAGDNVPPDGLEGGDDIKDTPKPLVYGRVRNIPLIPVNTQKLIYQVSDAAVESVEMTFDAGLPLQPFFTARSGGFSTSFVNAVAYGNGVFVAVANDNKIATSPDGVTWTQRTSGAGGSPNWLSVAFGAGVFVAVANTAKARYSSDGITWTEVGGSYPSSAPFPFAIRYTGAQFIATSSVCHTSADGITWASKSVPASQSLNSVAFGRGVYVVVSEQGNIYTTTDFSSYTLVESDTENLFDVLFTGERFIAGGASGRIETSDDGVAWYKRPSVVGTNDIFQIARVGGEIILSATQLFGSTREGISFSQRDRDVGEDVYGICHEPSLNYGTTVLVGRNGAVFSTDNTAPVSYASDVDLEDDSLAPESGNWGVRTSASGTYIRLGAQPLGQVTADVTHGAAASDRTAGQLIVDVLTKAGYSSGDWSASDITALDAAASGECGIRITTESAAEAIDRLADTVGAWWGFDATGRLRIQQFTAPSGTAALTLTDDDFLTFDQLPVGQPSTRTTLRYARHYVVQRDGLAGAVTAARRAELGREWRETAASDPAVATAFPLAEDTREDTTFASAAAAAAEATRRQTLRGTLRRRYAATVALTADTARLDLGDVVTVQSTRFGLGAGVLMRIVGLETRRADGRLRLSLYR